MLVLNNIIIKLNKNAPKLLVKKLIPEEIPPRQIDSMVNVNSKDANAHIKIESILSFFIICFKFIPLLKLIYS